MEVITKILDLSIKDDYKSALISHVLKNPNIRAVRVTVQDDIFVLESDMDYRCHIENNTVIQSVKTNDPSIYSYHKSRNYRSDDTILSATDNILYCKNDSEEYYFTFDETDDAKRNIKYAYKKLDKIYIECPYTYLDHPNDIVTDYGTLNKNDWVLTKITNFLVITESVRLTSNMHFDAVFKILACLSNYYTHDNIRVCCNKYEDTYHVISQGNMSKTMKNSYIRMTERGFTFIPVDSIEEALNVLRRRLDDPTMKALEKYVYRGIYFNDEDIKIADKIGETQYYYLKGRYSLKRFYIDKRDSKIYEGIAIYDEPDEPDELVLYINDKGMETIANPEPEKYNINMPVTTELNNILLSVFENAHKPKVTNPRILECYKKYIEQTVTDNIWRADNEVYTSKPSDKYPECLVWLKEYCKQNDYNIKYTNHAVYISAK